MASIVKHLVIDAKKTIGEKLLLLGVRPYAGYNEGVKGGQEGENFNCLSEAMGYEKIDIKIAGLLQPPFEFDGTPIPVEFEGLEAKVWQDWNNKGEVKLSITAKAIKPLSAKQVKLGGDKE
ncbi:MAG: hypothetical protein K2O15_12750 [Lachnospiraceae bacterium]|nr:hypothetical protein [Lachnospiraceae bacterium]